MIMSNEKRLQQIRDAARYKYPDERIHFIDGAKWADSHPAWVSVEKELQIAIEQGKVNALRQEVAEVNKEREYWNQVRIQAAIEFAAQILANHGGTPASVAENAVDYADALVAELQKKGGNDAS